MEHEAGERIRRIVTGHDRQGKSVVIMDDVDPHLRIREPAKIAGRVMWVSHQLPADISIERDPVTGKEGIGPPPNGSIFQIVDFPPFDPGGLGESYVQDMVGDASAPTAAARHPMVHRTRTLDYALVLSGEIEMLLSDSAVTCRQGDVIVQQGTVHGWVNKGKTPCRIAFIMIDAVEPAAWQSQGA